MCILIYIYIYIYKYIGDVRAAGGDPDPHPVGDPHGHLHRAVHLRGEN